MVLQPVNRFPTPDQTGLSPNVTQEVNQVNEKMCWILGKRIAESRESIHASCWRVTLPVLEDMQMWLPYTTLSDVYTPSSVL